MKKAEEKTPAQQGLPKIVVEAEQAALGSMLVEREAIRKGLGILRAEDFYRQDHQAVFRGIAAVYARDGSVDVVTLAEELRARGRVDSLNEQETSGRHGAPYLFALVERVATAAHVEHYARLVREASLDRDFSVQLSKTYVERTPDNVRRLHELMNALHGVHHRPAFDLRRDLAAYVDEVLDGKPPEVVDTGFDTLDRHLGGLAEGDVTVVGARTSGGKTAWMTKVALQVAERFAEQGKDSTCLYLTTEMSEVQVVSRLVPIASGVEAWKFRRRKFSKEEGDRIVAACADRLSKVPLLVRGKSQLSLSDISAAIAQTRPRLVLVDYLQRVRLGEGDNRSYQVMDFMVGLKTLAQETKTSIVIGCQLDRKLDKTAPEPENADLKDSGAIEAEADQVVLLWKPATRELAKEIGALPLPPGHHLIRSKVSKNRHGSAWGRADFALNGALVDMAEHDVEAAAGPDSRLPKEELWSH